MKNVIKAKPNGTHYLNNNPKFSVGWKKWTGSQIHTYLSSLSRHFTRIGKIPDFIRSSIGGFLSLDKSFLQKEVWEINCCKFQTMNRNNNVLLLLDQVWHNSLSGQIHPYLAAWTALNWTTGLSLVAFCNTKHKFQKLKKKNQFQNTSKREY